VLPYPQAIAAGQHTESASSSGAVADAEGDAAAVAVAAAAAAVAAGPDVVPLQLLLGDNSSSGGSKGFLQWLLVTDAAASLAVLEARNDLEPTAVLRLLEGECADDSLCLRNSVHARQPAFVSRIHT
jgi:hypothetical protein